MAQIFQINSRGRVPDLASAISPTLDVPMMEFDSIASALDSYSTQEEMDMSNAEENFNNLVEYHDQLTGERFDTQRQKEIFEQARQQVGIGDDAFKVSIDDLRDPFKVRGLRSKLGQIYERSDVKEILFEQQRGKEFLDRIWKLKDMNPILHKKGLNEYNKYRNGEISGFELLPQEFTPIDVDKTVSDALQLVPEINTSEMKEKYGVAYEEVVKQRSKELITDVVDMLKKNPIFRNNIEAMFTDENGVYDEEAANRYIQSKADEWAKKHTDIENVKVVRSGRGGTDKETTLDRMISSIKSFGVNDSELTPKMAEIEDIINNKDKSLQKIEESGNNIVITYIDDNAEGEQTIVIPRTNQSIAEAPNVGYTVNLPNGDGVELTDEDIQGYLSQNPKIENLNTFGKSHKAPKGLGKTKSNVGQETVVKVEGNNLVTNDIKFLRENGFVDEDVDYDELGEHGFQYKVDEDGHTTVSIPLTNNKRSIDIGDIEVYAPTKEHVEKQLSQNPIISKYDKDSDKYKTAVLFLSSPEIQDGYFEDVYLKEDYAQYMKSLQKAAPLKSDGTFDLSNVHSDIKKLLEKYPEEKLAYLAHHHSNSSDEFLLDGKAEIKGNPGADSDLKSVWKKIDEIMDKNPDLDFFELLKKIESGNKYDAVYKGSAYSSAIGKYQIVFDSHYKKIRKYMAENFDKLTPAEIKPMNQDDMTNLGPLGGEGGSMPIGNGSNYFLDNGIFQKDTIK